MTPDTPRESFSLNFHASVGVMRAMRKRIDSSFEKRGYILGALIDTGFFYMFTRNRVAGLADLKKQKLLTWFGEVETTFYKELGLDATPQEVAAGCPCGCEAVEALTVIDDQRSFHASPRKASRSAR